MWLIKKDMKIEIIMPSVILKAAIFDYYIFGYFVRLLLQFQCYSMEFCPNKLLVLLRSLRCLFFFFLRGCFHPLSLGTETAGWKISLKFMNCELQRIFSFSWCTHKGHFHCFIFGNAHILRPNPHVLC